MRGDLGLQRARYLGAWQPLGVVCAIDRQPREWTAAERRILEQLAQTASLLAELSPR